MRMSPKYSRGTFGPHASQRIAPPLGGCLASSPCPGFSPMAGPLDPFAPVWTRCSGERSPRFGYRGRGPITPGLRVPVGPRPGEMTAPRPPDQGEPTYDGHRGTRWRAARGAPGLVTGPPGPAAGDQGPAPSPTSVGHSPQLSTTVSGRLIAWPGIVRVRPKVDCRVPSGSGTVKGPLPAWPPASMRAPAAALKRSSRSVVWAAASALTVTSSPPVAVRVVTTRTGGRG